MASGPIQRDALVLIGGQSGLTFIPTPTPLTRLHYFDGKFLRAADLQLEQGALRQLVALANQAGGAGVVHGLDCSLAGGDRLQLGPGFAIDPAGRALLLPQGVSLGLTELIEASRKQALVAPAPQVVGTAQFGDCEVRAQAPAGQPVEGTDLYLVVLGHAEAYCGTEDVYGKLCEEACVTSTERPYIVEGVVVRAVPLTLSTPLARSTAVALTRVHLRSRVASAYFADEQRRVADLISRDGLASGAWCLGAAPLGGTGVPLAVVARSGDTTLFLDAWTARREQMEAPARHYWAWRMAMRPWSVFLAQVLQFQCQLRGLFQAGAGPVPDVDPCADVRGAARDATTAVAELMDFYGKVSERFATFRSVAPASTLAAELPVFKGGLAGLRSLKDRLDLAVRVPAILDRVLLRGGISELSPAGYLPVAPGSVLTVNRQVRQLLGEGVDLRFCVVRPDYVPHALEEAQHMERISLLQGLDDPRAKPQVDILVPDGEIVSRELETQGMGFEGRFTVPLQVDQGGAATNLATQQIQTGFSGAGRAEVLPAGGGAFHFAGALSADGKDRFRISESRIAAGRLAEVFRTAAAARVEETAVGGAAPGARIEERISTVGFERVGMVAVTPVGGFWTTLRCDRDVFALSPGDTTSASWRQLVAVPTLAGLVNDLVVQGTLRVEEVSGGDADRVVLGRFSAVSVTRETRSGETRPPETLAFEAEARVRLRRSPDGEARVDVRLGVTENVALFATVDWQGKPVAVTAGVEVAVRSGDVGQRVPFVSGKLRENREVLAAGEEHHTLALWGLEVIGGSLQDAGFPAAAAKMLFPPLPPPTDELEVRATRDWVLFHRRRTSTCAAEVVGPAPQPSRRYQAYHLGVPDEGAAKKVREALVAGSAVGNLGFRPVDVVEFAPGVPALASDPAAVKADWQAAGPGTSLLYAAIGSESAAAAEGKVLALGRLGQLQQVITQVTPADPAFGAEVLPAVPESLTVPGTDGAIVLLTRVALERVCQTVYWVQDQDAFKLITEMIRAGQIAQALQSDLLRLLGNVTFRAGTSEVLDQSVDPVVAAWNERGDGVPAGAAVVSGPNATSGDRSVHTQQTAKIQAALGGGPTVAPISNPAALPGDCPSIAFFVAAQTEPRVARMYVWAGRDNQQNRTIEEASTILQFRFQPDGSLLQPLTGGQLQVLRRFGPFAQVELASAEGANASGAAARLGGIADQLKTNGLLAPSVQTSVVTLSAAESALFNRDGIAALDVVLLRRG